ncbi:MAG: hypothetical protein RL154_468 [Pseudomonadota bacterium]|jgi:SAM-dependent methyltransferase
MTYKTDCPVCKQNKLYAVSKFIIAPDEPLKFKYLDNAYLAQCDHCGTVFRFPLEVYDETDFKKSGESYYDRVAHDLTSKQEFEESVKTHLELGQKHHYETLRLQILSKFKKQTSWLDVGSAGAPTQFSEYDFITIEPDSRVVEFSSKYLNTDKIKCSTIEFFNHDTLFDGIVFMHSLYCISEPEGALKKAYQLLKGGGILVVAISDYFTECASPFDGNKHLKIEEVFRGSTMNVYYNQYSIEYLANSCGFELLFDEKHEHVTSFFKGMDSRFFVFKKISKNIKINSALLKNSKRMMQKKLDCFVKTNLKATQSELKKLNKQNTIFMGDFTLFQQINSVYKFDKIIGFYDSRVKNLTHFNNVNILQRSLKAHKEIDIIVCDFKNPYDIVTKNIENIIELFRCNVNVYVPKISSGENSIIGQEYTILSKKHIRQFIVKKINWIDYINTSILSSAKAKQLLLSSELSKFKNVKTIAIAGSRLAAAEVYNFAQLVGLQIVCFIDDYMNGKYLDTEIEIVNRNEFATKHAHGVDLIIKGNKQSGFDDINTLKETVTLSRHY